MTLGKLIQDRIEEHDRVSQSLVVACVFGLSLLAGYKGSLSQMLMSLALLPGLIGAFIVLRKPELGLLALLVSAQCLPYALGTGTQTSLNAAILLVPSLAGLWVLDRVFHKDLGLAPSPANPPLVAFVITACLSFLSGNLPWSYFAVQANLPAQLGELAVFVFSAFAFWLVANQIKSLDWLWLFSVTFLVIGTIYLLTRLMPPVSGLADWIIVPDATGSLFWVWLVAVAGGLGLYHDRLRLGARIAFVGVALLALVVGITQAFSWASGWLPPFVALAVLVWFRFPRARWIWSFPIAATFLLNYERIVNAVLTTGGNLYSWETRLAAWQIVLEAAKANPILGLGPANYYNYVQLYPILGYYLRFNSHNNYVDLIAEVGIVGLLCFLWFAFAVWQEARSLVTAENSFARGYAYACMAGLAGSLAAGMLGDWFLPFVYNVGLAGFRSSILMWLFLGGLVVIKRLQGNCHTSAQVWISLSS